MAGRSSSGQDTRMHPGKERGAILRAYNVDHAVLAYSAKHLVGIEARADRSRQTAPRATSPTAEASGSEPVQSEFKSPVAYHLPV